MATVLQVFGIAMAVILSLFLAAVIVWVIILKLVKGISGNILEIFKTIFSHKKEKKLETIETKYKDVDGYKVTGKNGNSIFLGNSEEKLGLGSGIETSFVDNGVYKTERRYFQ